MDDLKIKVGIQNDHEFQKLIEKLNYHFKQVLLLQKAINEFKLKVEIIDD